MLGRPLFLLNLKTYPAAMGAGADRLATLLFARAGEAGIPATVAAAAADLGRLSALQRGPILGQHIDSMEAGAHTGFQVAESLSAVGARGSLVNHSEHPIPTGAVGAAVDRLRSLGLASVVCAATPERARRLCAFHPDYLAIEPPELIGGSVSVSEARPELIARAAAIVAEHSPGTGLLCGAGVRRRSDVRRALDLGAVGILVASAVATAPDPVPVVGDLLSGF